MEHQKNRRGFWYHAVERQHLKLNELKQTAQAFGLSNKCLYKGNIPASPKPEFHVCRLKHETTREGLIGIGGDGGFRVPSNGREPLVWWSLSVGPEEIQSAETRLLEETFPDRTKEQVSEQQSFLWKFTTSPAFLETSRLGSYRFTFPLEEVLMAYSQQFCLGAQPVMRVYKTMLFQQEVVHVVLIHSPENKDFSQYPLLTDDPNAVCVYREGCFIWRPEAMSETHVYKLVHTHDRQQMEAVGVSYPQYYVWDHIAIALHVEKTQVLRFDVQQLQKTLKFCTVENKNYIRKGETADSFDEAKRLVKTLWAGWSGPLKAELSLQQSSTGIRLVLVGRPGAGKTSSGNIILGGNIFGPNGSAAGLSSGTTESSLKEGTVFHWKVSIIDTPGLSEPSKPGVRSQIFRCINTSAPAPHIFILVHRLGTVSAEVEETMTQMKEIFGMNVLRRTVVLFTHQNQAEPEVQTQLQEAKSELEILEVSRKIPVLNIHLDHKDSQQVWDLLYEGVKLAVYNKI